MIDLPRIAPITAHQEREIVAQERRVRLRACAEECAAMSPPDLDDEEIARLRERLRAPRPIQ